MALALAEHGADVVVNDLYEDSAKDTAEEIRDLGRSATIVPGDVSDPEKALEIIETGWDDLGPIQHVVNNAGANSDDDLVDLPLEEWNKVIDINVTSTFLISRIAADKLQESGRSGSIVNISSVAGSMPQPGSGAYSTSKAAIIKLSQQMALEWARDQIRVNALCPGLIWTPATDSVYSDDELFEKRREWVPVKQIGEPEDVARAAMYLLAPDNEYTTGEALYIDGGAQCNGLNLIPGRAQHE
jgi:NAD(P)-dependent dehydrogenase (short-subunit alcohol dehydrogenase family)